MSAEPRSVSVVGAGLFGLVAAIELRRRGVAVRVVDPGPLPRPDSASVDISKAVRIDYGRDELYTRLGERALRGWERWNVAIGAPVFAATGIVFATSAPMAPGEFEHDSFEFLRARGHRLERLDRRALAQRFPPWQHGALVDGYYNPLGGHVDSASVMRWLLAQAMRAGVDISTDEAIAPDRIVAGLDADVVLVAAGAWTGALVSEVAPFLRPTGQPVVYLADPGGEAYQRGPGTPWGADIARRGWFGFPVTHGVIKLANHGPGLGGSPDDPRDVPAAEIERFRAFLRESFPALALARLVDARLCFYCDTPDGDFWIDGVPGRPHVVVAAGGSGHAFKFAPVLGGLIADVVLRRPNADAARFAWRTPTPASERARAAGADRR